MNNFKRISFDYLETISEETGKRKVLTIILFFVLSFILQSNLNAQNVKLIGKNKDNRSIIKVSYLNDTINENIEEKINQFTLPIVNMNLRNTTFVNKGNFENYFIDSLLLVDVIWSNGVNFSNDTINAYTDYIIHFKNDVYFSNNFLSNWVFENDRFDSEVKFEYNKIKKITLFVMNFFKSGVTFRSDIFNSTLYIGDCEFDSNLIFTKCSFDSLGFGGSHFKSNLEFWNSHFNSILYLSYAKYDSTIIFNNCIFEKNIDFFLTNLPAYLEFSGRNENKELIDLTPALPPSNNEKCNLILTSTNNTTGIDIGKLRIKYSMFKLLFPDSVSYESRKSTYLALLNNFKRNNYDDSYELLDKEFRNWELKNHYYLSFDSFSLIWFYYGYNKGWIFGWTLLLLIIFSLITTKILEPLIKLYPITVVAKHLKETYKEDIKLKYRQKIWPSFIFTFILFFGLKLDYEKLKSIKFKWIFYILLVYTLGLLCTAYLFNFVISK